MARRAARGAVNDDLSDIDRALQRAVDRGELTAGAMALARERLATTRRPRPDGQGRRGDILEAATRVFATKGYHGATLRDVADELGLTYPTLYYYFKSKQEILDAIGQGSADRVDSVIEIEVGRPHPNQVEALRQVLTAYATHIAGQESTAIMMRNFEEMSPAVRHELADRRRRREGQVLEIVLAGVGAGELTSSQPKIAVLSAFEFIHAVHNWFDPNGGLSRSEVAEVLVALLLDGLRARPSA